MQNSFAKKIFAVGSAAAIALSAFAPFAAQAAVHAAGTNVSSPDGTVSMIMPDGTRRPYTSAGAFLSYGFNSWSQVVTASAEDLALPVGSFIPPQDGSIICSDRGADKGTCYQISGGMKFGFTSAAVFTGLGFSFANSMPGDVSWMPAGSFLINSATMAHLPGTLVNNNGTVQLVGGSGLLGIPDLATFNSWGYSFSKVVPANTADKAMSQTGVMTARTAGMLSPSWTANPTAPVISGSVSAALATDSPAASSLVQGSLATIAKFTFNGSGTVTSVTMRRTGVSEDTTLRNVYLYDGATRLTDAASVGGMSSINFTNASGLFNASGMKTISVVAEISSSATNGQTVGIQLTGFAVANGTPAAVAYQAATHTITSATLAAIDFGTVTPSGSSFDPAKDVEVFKSTVSIGTRDVTLSRMAIRQIGSVNNTDLNNFRLLIDGTQVAQVQNLTADGYAYFSFAPTVVKSGNRNVRVLADVIAGSSRTFQFQVRNKVDVDFTDSQFGAIIAPTYASGNFPAGSASSNSINGGSLTFQKTVDSASGDVIKDSSGVKLAKYTVTAYGEPVKIETLTVAATSSDASVGNLRNGKVLINGAQYGSTANLVKISSGGTAYTLNYTVQPGTPVTLEVVADMFDNDGTNDISANDTVYARILAGSSNAQKMVSLGYINAPAALVDGNSVTVVTGSVSMGKQTSYANQTTPLPQTAYKFAAFNLVGATSEDVNVDTITVAVAAVSGSTFDYADLTDVMVKVNGQMFGTVKSTLSSGSNTFSGNFKLAKNANVSVEVFASLVSGATNTDSGRATVTVSGTTDQSGVAVTTGGITGQTIAVGSGTISTSFSGGNSINPSIVAAAAGATQTVGVFKLTTTNEAFTITEVTATSSALTTVSEVRLLDCGTTGTSCQATALSSRPAGTSVTFSGLSYQIPANSDKYLGFQVVFAGVGTGMGTTSENVAITFSTFKANNSSGVQSTNAVNLATNAVYAYKAVPTIAPNTTGWASTLNGGNQTLAKVNVSSGSGTIEWNKIVFSISKSVNPVLATSTFEVYDVTGGSSNKVLGTISGGVGLTATGTVSAATVSFAPTSIQQVAGTRTYELRGDISGTFATGDNVSTRIANPISSFAASTAAASVSASASFVWSDVSAQSHSASTSDWTGDYLVSGLPTASQTLSK